MNPISSVRTKALGGVWSMLRSPEARRVLAYAKPLRGLTIQMGVLSLLSAGLELARMGCLLVTLNTMTGLPQPSLGWLGQVLPRSVPLLLLNLLSLTVSKSCTEYVRRVLSSRAQAEFVNAIRSDAILGVLQQPLEFFTDRRAGEAVFIVNSQTARFSSFLPMLSDLSACVLTILTLGAMALQIHAALTTGLLVFACLISVAVRPFYRRLQRIGIEQASASSDAAAQFQDAVRGIKLVKTFHAEEFERERCASRANHVSALQVQATMERQVATEIATIGGVVAVIAVCAWGLSVGVPGAVLLSLLLLAGRILPEVSKIREAWMTLGSLWGHLAQVVEFLPQGTVVPDPSGVIRSTLITNGMIGFITRGFRYADGPEVLAPLQIALKEGEPTALVGLTGSGKSTLLDIMAGLRPTGGTLYTLGEKTITYLTQEPILMYGTISDNVHYGAPPRNCEWPPFLQISPATQVGESGSKLSGGQRQLVALARLAARPASVWLLDEPTSNLDAETEAKVMEWIVEHKRDRIIVVASHRLRAIKKFDRIIVLHDGRIVEDGPHAKLVKRDGLYARLWRLQEVL